MAYRPLVCEVHDLHIWEITSGLSAASAHVLVAPGADCHSVRADLEAFLSREYGITHATLQVDHAAPPSGPATAVAGVSEAERHCDDAHGPAYRPGDNLGWAYHARPAWSPAAGQNDDAERTVARARRPCSAADGGHGTVGLQEGRVVDAVAR